MAKQFLHHQDLFLGAHWQVPLDFQKPISAAVVAAIERSVKEQAWVEIQGAPLFIKAEHKNSNEGNASFNIACWQDLGNGKVKAKTLLYSAVISCVEASRPLSWRVAFSSYLNHMLESHPDCCFAAPEPMLRGDVPLLCGFARTFYTQLSKDERNFLLMVVWVAGLELMRICQREVRALMAKGVVLEPDPELFLELRDWSL